MIRTSAIFLLALLAAEWSTWRGAQRNALLSERQFSPPRTWPAAPRQLWQIEIGIGHASPLVIGENVIAFTRAADEETITCCHLATGKIRWQQRYPAPCKVDAAADPHGLGPKATPLIIGEKVITLGLSGLLRCWNLTNGQLLWKRDFSADFPKTWPLFGTAASPLNVNNHVVAHVGGHDGGALCMFDLATGKTLWAWPDDGPAYTSPILETVGQGQQIITQTQKFNLGLDALTGKTRWKIPYETQYVQNVIDPVVYKNLVIFSGYSHGITAYDLTRVSPQGELAEVWHQDKHSFYMSTPVLVGDRLLGFSQRNSGQFVSLDPATGKIHWQGEPRQGENAALQCTATVATALLNTGELVFFSPQANSFQQLARYRVAKTPTWAQPAFLGAGQFLIKDEHSLALFTLEP